MSAGGRLVRLSDAAWEDDAPGIRARAVQGVDGRRFAIVEYGPGAARDDWCLEGHYGYVLEGEIEYRFEDGSEPLRLAAGDALWLVGGGPGHQGHNVADARPRSF
jgi:quercetin dioxygenase-like cupin family protein